MELSSEQRSSPPVADHTTSTSSDSPMSDFTFNESSRSANSKKDYERRFALDSVERDAARVWTTLPSRYRTEKDFVLAALKSESLPPKSEFERTLPQSLRFDRDVVLAFCDREDFATLYYSRHLFVPDCLTGDKEVMMAYCKKIPRALQECTEELCNDRDVVLAAISLGGLELQYASRALQEDKELVMAACAKDGRALEYCPPGPTRTELTSNREFMLSVLSNNGGSMLRLVPEPLKRDRTLVLEALANGGLRWRLIPDAFKNDKEFLLTALSRNSRLYLDVCPLHKDVDFALAAIVSEDSTDEVHRRALDIAPQLKQNREVIMAIAKRGDRDLLESLFNGGGAQRFLDDKELMLAAIHRDCRLFKYARARLREDPEVILASIQTESAIDTMRDISPDTRGRYPEISIKAIQVTCPRRLRYLESLIPEALWQNRDVVLAWVRRGGNVLDHFERTLQTDREMSLELAEHNWTNFKKVGQTLRDDRDFMILAVQRDGRVIRFASHAIQSDFDVLVRAVSNHCRALSSVIVNETDFKSWVKAKLDLHMTFLRDFLRGIAINKPPHRAPSLRSALPMLDRGVETSQAFKQLIAEYLGVPVQEELKTMRQAWTNLSYPPSTNNGSAMENGDRDEVAEDELAQMMGARRRERWERRMHHFDPADRADRDIADREMDRFAFRQRVVMAHRRHDGPAGPAAGLFGGQQEQQPNINVEFNIAAAMAPLALPPPQPPRHAVDARVDADVIDLAAREHFFAMLDDQIEWDEL